MVKVRLNVWRSAIGSAREHAVSNSQASSDSRVGIDARDAEDGGHTVSAVNFWLKSKLCAPNAPAKRELGGSDSRERIRSTRGFEHVQTNARLPPGMLRT